MPHPIELPVHHAESLVRTLDALRGETQTLMHAGFLMVSVDALLEGSGTVHEWLADLDAALEATTETHVALPAREAWQLQHVVYGLSSVLVWAHELHGDGRIATALPGEALSAWAIVEQAAGFGGRTSSAIGYSSGRFFGRDLAPRTVVLDEPTTRVA